MVVFNGGPLVFIFIQNSTYHYSFSKLIDGTLYFVGIVDDMDSLFVRKSSVGSL